MIMNARTRFTPQAMRAAVYCLDTRQLAAAILRHRYTLRLAPPTRMRLGSLAAGALPSRTDVAHARSIALELIELEERAA